MKASLETNGRGNSILISREITLQETQGLKTFILIILTIMASILIVGSIVGAQLRINILESENAKLEDQVKDLRVELSQTEAHYNSTVTELSTNINKSNIVINSLDKQVKALLIDNKALANQYDSLQGEYNVLASRKELYDKYEYVVTYGGKRTDVTYDQIKLAEDLMIENGYDPDILFSVLMVESRGDETAKNKESTATGYGQFLKRTGKYVYEDLLNNGSGTYSHSMAYDGDTNITMMASYLSHLLDNNNGNLFKAIRNYSGKDNNGTNMYISWMMDFGPNNLHNTKYVMLN